MNNGRRDEGKKGWREKIMKGWRKEPKNGWRDEGNDGGKEEEKKGSTTEVLEEEAGKSKADPEIDQKGAKFDSKMFENEGERDKKSKQGLQDDFGRLEGDFLQKVPSSRSVWHL